MFFTKSKAVLPLAFAIAATSTVAQAENLEPKRGHVFLKGSFSHAGEEYQIAVPFDLIRARQSKAIDRGALILPEEYKRYDGNSPQNFLAVTDGGKVFQSQGGGFKVRCDGLMAAGLKGFVGYNPGTIECSFKPGNGSSNPEQYFDAFFIGASKAERKALQAYDFVPNDDDKLVYFRGVKPDSKKIKYVAESGLTLSLDVDVVDYRNGNGHKVFLYPKQIHKKLNDQLEEQGFNGKVSQCKDVNSGNAKGVAGRAPVLNCVLYLADLNGKRDPRSYEVVPLK